MGYHDYRAYIYERSEMVEVQWSYIGKTLK